MGQKDMKKIFAISFLSVFAVVGLARAGYNNYYSGFYASGTDVNENYNLASVNFVQGRYDEAVQRAENLVIKSDKKTSVGGTRWNYGYAGSDENAPTIKYMEDSIAEAVDGIDTSGLVDKEHVVTSEGTDMANGNPVLESAADNPDDYVPTVGMVDNLAKTMNETLEGKVDKAQGVTNKNAIMITNAAGNVIPAPVGACANTTNKCALVTGVDTSGNLVLQWEVIARNVPQPTAEE